MIRYRYSRALAATLAAGAILVLLASALPSSTAPSAPPSARAHAQPLVGVGQRPTPHPTPVPVSGRPSGAVRPLTHWWDGGYYAGPTLAPTVAKMTLTIPDAVPSAKEFYYVLLSTWDNAGSYDQVGISNDYGTWGWTWSWTSSCAGTYYYTPNQMALQRGATYVFEMSITAGNVTFTVTKGTTTVGTIVGNSGGTAFVMSGFYSCGSASYYDYTDYEEIYATVQSTPSFNFVFAKNVVSNGTVTNWSSFSSGAPSGITTAVAANTVRQENQGFSIKFSGAPDHVTLSAKATAYHTNLTLTRWFATGNVTLAAAGMPSGLTVTFGTPGAAPPFTSAVTLRLASVAAGTYSLTLTGTPTTGEYTYVTLRVTVL